MKPEQALKRLLDGNARYVAGIGQTGVDNALRNDLYINGQHPYAVIVGCSDSRVPVELVFDAKPGELFVIRTAGNVVGTIEMGSIEFAVSNLKTSLILVLGHQNCGAVRAAIEGGGHSAAIRTILNEIRPSVPTIACDDPYSVCEDNNIRQMMSKISVNHTISNAILNKEIQLCSAKYSLETGIVSFFE